MSSTDRRSRTAAYATAALAGLLAVALIAAAGRALMERKRRAVRQAYVRDSLPSTVATVVASTVEDIGRPLQSPRLYRPRITYRYEVRGREYRRSHVMPTSYTLGRGSATFDESTRIAAQYPPGRRLRVSYDPENPQGAVLDVPAPAGTWDLGTPLLVARSLSAGRLGRLSLLQQQ